MSFNAAENISTTAATNALLNIDATLNQIAQPSQPQVEYARERITEISPQLKEAAQIPFSARGVLFGLLLDRQPELRNQQLELLNKQLSPEDAHDLFPVITRAADIEDRLRLPLVELCLSPLKQLSVDQQHEFFACLQLLVFADNKVSLMEWAVYRIVLHNTLIHNKPTRNRNLRELQTECEMLLSLLAYAGATDDAKAQAAFSQAKLILNFPTMTLLPRASIKLADADTALERLNLTKPLQKPQLLKALSQCILQDGEVTITEAELFRAIADSLDCPIPPLITGTHQ